jgi:hypothetical protein
MTWNNVNMRAAILSQPNCSYPAIPQSRDCTQGAYVSTRHPSSPPSKQRHLAPPGAKPVCLPSYTCKVQGPRAGTECQAIFACQACTGSTALCFAC